MVSIDIMNTQINVRMPQELLAKAQEKAEAFGYGSVQEFIRETVREKVFEAEPGYETLSKEELVLVKKLIVALEETHDYRTEEELMHVLDS